MRETTKKWNLDRDIKFSHRVTETIWLEELGKWQVSIQTGGRILVEYADLLISGQGVLEYVARSYFFFCMVSSANHRDQLANGGGQILRPSTTFKVKNATLLIGTILLIIPTRLLRLSATAHPGFKLSLSWLNSLTRRLSVFRGVPTSFIHPSPQQPYLGVTIPAKTLNIRIPRNKNSLRNPGSTGIIERISLILSIRVSQG